MNSKQILALGLQTFHDLSRPLVKTIAVATTALIGCEVVGVSALGRRLEGSAQPNSGIRRIERMIKNPRLKVPLACGGLVQKLIRPHRRTYVCMDWTDQGKFQRLDLSVATGSRTIPIFWKVVAKDLFSTSETSQNRVEEEFIREFVALLPRGAEVVLLADRGFGRTEFFRFLSGLQLPLFFYVIRIKGDAWLRSPEGTFRLKEQSVPPGQVWDLGLVTYRDIDAPEDTAVRVRTVVAFGMGAEGPWRLATNLPDVALDVAGAYGRRFECEETFRNQKDLRFGFGLKLVRLSEASRYERLLVVVALACLVTFGVGVQCEKIGLHQLFQANTRTTRQHNLIGLGCYWFKRVRLTVRGLVEIVVGAILRGKVAFRGATAASPSLTYRVRPSRRKPKPTPAPLSPPSDGQKQTVVRQEVTEEQMKIQMAISRILAM